MAPSDHGTAIRRLIEAFNRRRFAEYTSAFHPDAVIEYPQSGERVEGRSNALQMFEAFTASPTFEVWRIDSADSMAVLHAAAHYPNSEPIFAILEYQFEGDMIVRETAYFGAPFAAAEWRRPFARVEPFVAV